MGKHWQRDEIVSACKYYVNSTPNRIRELDQDFITFLHDHVSKLERFAPEDFKLNRHHHSADFVYPYLIYNIFSNMQKFQKALLRYQNLVKPRRTII